MKANELRIGNLVNFKGNQRVVYQIRKSGCDFHIDGNDFHSYVWDAINPILITEEFLLKLSFEKCEGRHGIYFKSPHDKQVRIYFYDGKWCIGYVSDNAKGFSTIGSFMHVHKLQNFHFEFVGKELELK